MADGARAQIECDLLAALDQCAAHGAGAVFSIRGEAGIGKTTLMSRIAQHAGHLGVAVWRGAATPLTQAVPFRVIEEIRDRDGEPFLTSVAPLVAPVDAATGRTPNPDASRYPVVEAGIEAAEFHAQAPALILIDDAQWIDSASVALVGAFANIAVTHPLVLVIAHRTGPHSEPMVQLERRVQAAGAHTVDIPPLCDDEVQALLHKLCGGSPGDALRRRAQGAGGNPFLLSEFVNGLMAEGRFAFDGSEVDVELDEVPDSLQAGVTRELRRLGDEVTLVVRAASVQGLTVEVGVLAAVLERTPISLAAPIEVATEAGLLEERQGELWFRHELVRTAIYQQMPQSIRRATHRQIAGVLARMGATAALVGSHIVLGDDKNDPAVVGRLQKAAEETGAVDPATALEFLDRARSLTGVDFELRRVIERARLDALTAAGRTAEAESTAHWLLEASGPDERYEILARLGGLATIAGDSARALSYLEQARDAAATDPQRSPIIALTSMTCATNGDYSRARRLAEEAVTLGKSVDDPVGQSVGLALLARMSTYHNEIEDGLRLGAAAVATADADATGTAHSYVPSLHFGMTAFDADQLETALAMAQHGNRLAEKHQMAWSLPLFGALAAGCHYRVGALDLAEAEARTAVELAAETNSRVAITWAYATLALVSVDQGHSDEAARWSALASESWQSGVSPLGVDHMVLAKARAAETCGGIGDAFEELAATWDLFDSVALEFCQPILAFDLARLAKHVGDDERYLKTEDATILAAERSRVPALVATADWIVAVRTEDAPGAWRALDALQRTERRLDAGRWMASEPDLLAQDRGAEGVLRQALEVFESAGADGCAAEVRGRLRSAPTVRPADGGIRWNLLTPTELDIVRQLADGCTNAEIARRRNRSRRTVESHLRKAYQKLGIDGRVKLTVAAAEHFRDETPT